MSAYTIIKTFVNSIDSTIQIDFDKDFCVNVDEKIVYIECCEHKESNILIQNFVKENFEVIMHPFLIGLLHEIGHIFTFNDLLDDERTVQCILLHFLYKENNFKNYSYKYFSLPAEYEATAWAVNYYKTHTQQCEQFLDELFIR